MPGNRRATLVVGNRLRPKVECLLYIGVYGVDGFMYFPQILRALHSYWTHHGRIRRLAIFDKLQTTRPAISPGEQFIVQIFIWLIAVSINGLTTLKELDPIRGGHTLAKNALYSSVPGYLLLDKASRKRKHQPSCFHFIAVMISSVVYTSKLSLW